MADFGVTKYGLVIEECEASECIFAAAWARGPGLCTVSARIVHGSAFSWLLAMQSGTFDRCWGNFVDRDDGLACIDPLVPSGNVSVAVLHCAFSIGRNTLVAAIVA